MTLAEFSARSVKVASLRLPYAEANTYLRRCIACFDIDEPDIGTTLEGLLDIVKARMCLQWSLSTNPWRRDAPVAQTSLQHFMGTGIVHMFCLSNQYIYIYTDTAAGIPQCMPVVAKTAGRIDSTAVKRVSVAERDARKGFIGNFKSAAKRKI